MRLARLQDRRDLRTVVGNAALPSTLEQAGMPDADQPAEFLSGAVATQGRRTGETVA